MEAAELASLLQAAASVRDKAKGRTVSYSKKVFIPLTHLCRDYCGYCTFRADPEAGRQAYMTPEDVLAVAEAGRRAGCKEALFSLGDQPERVFSEAKEFLRNFGFANTLEYLAAMTELADLARRHVERRDALVLLVAGDRLVRRDVHRVDERQGRRVR